MSLTPTWVVVNLVFPVVLPPASMFMAGRYMARTPEEKKNARVLRTMQDGQLGWVSIAWCALALYEAWDKIDVPELHRFVLWSSGGLAFLIFGAIFISVGGALNAPEVREEQKKYARDSVILTLAAGALFGIVHARVS